MAITTATLVDRVRAIVYNAEPRNRPYQTTLSNSPGTGGTTFSVADGDAWQVGDMLETEDGELCLVTAIATNDLTVVRAQGTVSLDNVASGETVRKNPRFSYDAVALSATDIVNELYGQLPWLTTETIAYTTDDWYDVADTAMEDAVTAWYIQDGDFKIPFFKFHTDLANTQPKVFLAAAGFTGNIFLAYTKYYTATSDMPARLLGLMAEGVTYKLLGAASAASTHDPGKRTDRTVQGGQEARDSYWHYREFVRLRDHEIAYVREQIKKLPANRIAKRSRRFIP